jgi:propionyl-CoA synthetase
MFSTSDIGWVVGHSYIIYGPLIAGMATIMYEGTPIRPDPGIWWQIVEKYKVNVMFSAPTAIRVLKKQRQRHGCTSTICPRSSTCSSPASRWTSLPMNGSWALKLPVIDNYWQTETGWPILSTVRGIEDTKIKFGTPSFPVYGYELRIFREDGTECGQREGHRRHRAAAAAWLPVTIWGDDERFVKTYFSLFKEPMVYSSFDWGIMDDEGYHFILGRTDDVINVAGHRLARARSKRRCRATAAIAEVAVVGVRIS